MFRSWSLECSWTASQSLLGPLGISSGLSVECGWGVCSDLGVWNAVGQRLSHSWVLLEALRGSRSCVGGAYVQILESGMRLVSVSETPVFSWRLFGALGRAWEGRMFFWSTVSSGSSGTAARAPRCRRGARRPSAPPRRASPYRRGDRPPRRASPEYYQALLLIQEFQLSTNIMINTFNMFRYV